MILKPEISEEQFILFREFIHEKFGILLKDEKINFLKMKLGPRLVALGLASFGEYLQYLKYNSNGSKEMAGMISVLTNTETYLFRELCQLEVFRDQLLAGLKEKKLAEKNQKLRILSAGCSTGEEVYTLAMLIYETGGFFWGWDVKIFGMDVNENALNTAIQGKYHPRSFRMTEPGYMNRFFSANGNGHVAKDSIRQIVSFLPGNITDAQSFEELKPLDAIFCRNVLIYFSDDKIKTAIENFHSALAPGGWLLLGHSETLTGIYDDLETHRFPGTIVYRKPG